MSTLRVGAIGAGYWGPNLIRNLIEHQSVTVVGVADLDTSRLEHLNVRYPQIERLTDDFREFFTMGLDAVVISTPPETHFGIVTECLEAGLHVLVEKPLTTDSRDALELVELAERLGLILMVGHTFEYNPAVHSLREMLVGGEIGEVRYIDAVRVGLGLFHPTLNVVWDLAPHDISILVHLLGEMPASVSTRGIACVQDSIEDVAYMTLTFPSGILAHTRMSWLDPRKTRRITVVGSERMVVYDDVESHEKLKVYDKRVDAIRMTDTFGEFQFAYHYGSVVSPYIRFEEPLMLECAHFVDCIENGKQPLTDGWNGLRVVRVIEAAQRSLQEDGRQVAIDPDPSLNGFHAVEGARLRVVGNRE